MLGVAASGLRVPGWLSVRSRHTVRRWQIWRRKRRAVHSLWSWSVWCRRWSRERDVQRLVHLWVRVPCRINECNSGDLPAWSVLVGWCGVVQPVCGWILLPDSRLAVGDQYYVPFRQCLRGGHCKLLVERVHYGLLLPVRHRQCDSSDAEQMLRQ